MSDTVRATMTYVRLLACVLALSVLTLPISAQELAAARTGPVLSAYTPLLEAPKVAPVEQPYEHKFFDRQQMLALYAHAGMRIVDTIKTCRELSDGGREDWIPTQSCAGIAAWQAGSVGLALGVGWLFHKTGHHRLERLTPWVGTSASAAGWVKSVFNIK
jgi:hypothetical protein